jgi:hypothetical protein
MSLRARLAYAVVAACALAPGAAHAGPPVEVQIVSIGPKLATAEFSDGTTAAGPTCSMSALSDPTREEGTFAGTVSGGAVFALPGQDRVTCTLQGEPHPQPPPQQITSITASGSGAVAIPPATVAYDVPPGQPVFLCTEWWHDDEVLYYDAAGGTFVDQPEIAMCDTAVSLTTSDVIDPIVCPVFAAVEGGDGDIQFVWDCPPYAA